MGTVSDGVRPESPQTMMFVCEGGDGRRRSGGPRCAGEVVNETARQV